MHKWWRHCVIVLFISREDADGAREAEPIVEARHRLRDDAPYVRQAAVAAAARPARHVAGQPAAGARQPTATGSTRP